MSSRPATVLYTEKPARRSGVASSMRTLSLLFLLVATTSALPAQGPGRGNSGGPLPLQGKQLPDATAYDEKGDPVSLRQALKGKHGVIVFGCLT